jgi:NADH-quinone oxidoreductase subunit N
VSNETVYLLLPEIILVLLATLIYLGGAFFPSRPGWSWLAAASILLAGVALYQQQAVGEPQAADTGASLAAPIDVDEFSTTLRFGVLGVGLLFVMLAARSSEDGESSQFMGSLLLILAGAMLVTLANDLVLTFVALELISIPTYAILYLGRGNNLLESATKYFFLSVLSSALLLYGFTFLYGAGGSTNFEAIRQALAAAGPERSGAAAFAPLALVLIFAGLAFRLTAVPFHFYAPDVYQGTSNPNAGLLAVVPKIAGLVVLVRIAFVAMPGLERIGWQLSLCVAIVTMTLGNLLALWQNNVRRLLAYSSIAHAGYMLIGLAVGFAVAGGASEAQNFDGLGATFFYLLVYAAATAGSFAALTYLGGQRASVDSVDELAGLSSSYPKTAAALAIFMFSLTGLPPLAGFWGKFVLFTAALGVDAKNPEASSLWPWFLALAIVGAVNAAISAGYYLRIVAVMYFRPSLSRPEGQGGTGAALAMAACATLVLGIGCYPGPLVARATRASQAARSTPAEPPAAQAQTLEPGPRAEQLGALREARR